MHGQTFIEVAEQLIKDAEVRVKLGEAAPTLVRDYRQRLNAYCRPFFGSLSLDGVTRLKLREFRVYLAEKGLKSGTINPILSFTSMVLKFAEESGLIDDAPAVPRARNRDTPRPAFTQEEYGRLLEGLARIERGRPKIVVKGKPVDWELRAIVTFSVNSFVRPGDIFMLRHRHVEVRRSGGGHGYLRLSYPASKGHAAPVITMPAAAQIYEPVVARRRRPRGPTISYSCPSTPIERTPTRSCGSSLPTPWSGSACGARRTAPKGRYIRCAIRRSRSDC